MYLVSKCYQFVNYFFYMNQFSNLAEKICLLIISKAFKYEILSGWNLYSRFYLCSQKQEIFQSEIQPANSW